MSFDINWNKLDDELAGYVIQFLNRNFQTINKPAFIGNINVVAFDWGTTAPTIEIIDITDPFPEFYEPTDTEDDLENSNNDTHNNNNTPLNNNTPSNINTPSNNNSNNNNNNSNNNNNKSLLPTSPTITNDPYFDTVETNSHYRPERFSYPLNNHHQQQQLQQQRIQLMHSFHRSPLVAPQHPFNNHISPTTPHGANSYFPSRTTSPTTSSNYIDYLKQQQQNDHLTMLSSSSNNNNNQSNNSGIDINDWIDDELNHHLSHQHHHTNTSSTTPPPQQQQPSSSSIQNNNEATRMDFQAHLLVSYKGDMSMTILTELKMNYPSMEFMSLPIQLCVRSVEFEATAVVAYIQSMSRVCVSMLEAEDDEITTLREKDIIGLGSLLRHVQIESIVGDEQKHVLKNVGKIERFIVDQLRRMLDDELVFPSYQCVELS